MGVKPNWTNEELNYLTERWGTVSAKVISIHLGRTLSAIIQKSQKIGLGDPTLHFDGITICQLMQALNKSYGAVYAWIRDYGMPVKSKVFVKALRVKVIAYKEFWEWAECNKELLNFAKMEPNTMGPEPDWVKIKRNADQLRSQKTWQSVKWSAEEDQRLQQLINLPNMTYSELSSQLNRSVPAIKRRMYDLYIVHKLKRARNDKYSDSDIKKLSTMAQQGHAYETIAKELGKSALGVRGKLERMNFDFKRREFKKSLIDSSG
jgi:hypothetical protein